MGRVPLGIGCSGRGNVMEARAFFFFQGEDGMRDKLVTGVQACALPISAWRPRPGRGRRREPASDAGCARLHAARDADRARDRGRAPRDRLRRHARCPRRVAPGRGPRRGLSARARRRALAGAHGGLGVSLRGSARRGAGVGALVLRERHASRVRRAVVARTVSHPDRIRRGRGRVRRERGASRARGPTARAAEPEPVHRCGGGLPRPDGHGAQAPVHGRERRVAGRVGRSERQDHAARRPHHARHHAQRADRTAAATDGLAPGEGRMRAERGFALIVVLLVMAIVGVVGAEFAYSMRLEATAVRAYKDRILASHLSEAAFAQAVREIVAESSYVTFDEHGLLTFYRQDRLPLPQLPREKVDFEGGQYSYRITDEEARINLNASPPDRVDRLPQFCLGLDKSVRDVIGDSLQDWRDPNEEHRLNGAESDDFYLKLPLPYRAHNANLESTTELLQIHGVLETPAIFWGTPERPGLVDVVTVK